MCGCNSRVASEDVYDTLLLAIGKSMPKFFCKRKFSPLTFHLMFDQIVVESGPPPEEASLPVPKRIKISKTPAQNSNSGSEKVDERSFPHFWHSLLRKLKDTFRVAEIGPSSSTPSQQTTPKGRWRYYFPHIAHTLNAALSESTAPKIDQRERMTLSDLIARAPTFASVLVPNLVPSVEKLEGQDIADIYSEFTSFVNQPSLSSKLAAPSMSPSTPYPALLSLLKEFKVSKDKLKHLKHLIHMTGVLKHIHVHRYEHVPDHAKNILTKMIVIDHPDFERYPPETHHHIDSKKAHIITPVGDHPQIHLRIIQTDLTPSTDEEIIELWHRSRRGEEIPKSFWKWYIGGQVFNLFAGDELQTHLSQLADTLDNSNRCRKPIPRGKNIPSTGTISGSGPV
jgi:hypothetical protein